MSLRSNASGSPKPALLTSTSMGRSRSLSRRATFSSVGGRNEVGGQHLDLDAELAAQLDGERIERLPVAGDEHEVGASLPPVDARTRRRGPSSRR